MYIPRFKYTPNDVPILSKNEIDLFAEEFIKDFQPEILSIPSEVNIEWFLEGYQGLVLDYQWLSNDGRYLGMTVFNDTNMVTIYDDKNRRAEYISASAGTVIIDNSLLTPNQIHRYRFTIAHESAHWIFHRRFHKYDARQLSLFEMKKPFIECRENGKGYYDKTAQGKWDDKKWLEWQADRFASAILMPKSSIEKLVEQIAFRRDVNHLIKEVVEQFNVSYAAAKYRLLDLGIVAIKNGNYEQLKFG